MEIGAGLLQATLAAALHIIPPLIPLPTWNNELLTCGLDGFDCWRIRLPKTFASVFLSVPMVSGHDCFGLVLYPVSTHFFISPATHPLCHLIGIVVDHSSRQFDGRCHGRHA